MRHLIVLIDGKPIIAKDYVTVLAVNDSAVDSDNLVTTFTPDGVVEVVSNRGTDRYTRTRNYDSAIFDLINPPRD